MDNFWKTGRKLLLTGVLLLMFTVAWTSNFGSMMNARAATIEDLPFVVAETNVLERAASGTGEQVEGGIDEAVGTVKRNVGQVSGQTEGAAQQAKGKLKQGIGNAKEEAGAATAELENKSEGLVDSVKDFFDID
ncbi:MAG: CsbD family protein [Cyanophyceae cyanobacterium]